MSPRPIVALDIDGVFNPDISPHNSIMKEWGWTTIRWQRPDGSKAWVWINKLKAHELRRSVEASDAELVWLTSWNDEANDYGKVLGFPELPVITVPERERRRHAYPDKFNPLMEYAQGRPWAWLDDEIDPEAHMWAAATGVYHLDYSPPVPGQGRLLLDISAHLGLRSGHLARLRSWLSQFEPF